MGKAALGLATPEEWAYTIGRLIRPDTALAILLGIVGAFPVLSPLRRLLEPRLPGWALAACKHTALIFIFLAACSASISNTFNPFLYFRF